MYLVVTTFLSILLYLSLGMFYFYGDKRQSHDIFGRLLLALQVSAPVHEELEEDVEPVTDRELNEAVKKGEKERLAAWRAERVRVKKEKRGRAIRDGTFQW